MDIKSKDCSSPESRAEERYHLLRTRAVLVAGNSNSFDPTLPPLWFDKEAFARCNILAKKHYFSLFIGHFIGLLMVIQIPMGLAPLLATGNSSTVSKLYRRYLSTIIHVTSWYETDLFTRETRAYKSLKQVRRMHTKTAELMNEKFAEKIDNRDRIWLNQFSFIITQWAFIGPVILFPKSCGLHSATDEDIQHLNYLWRVIGHCMGIEDQFNLCSGDLTETRALCKLIFDREYRPYVHQTLPPAPIGWEMGQGIVTALTMINPTLSWEGLMNYWYRQIEIPIKIKFTSFKSRFSYCALTCHIQGLLRFSFMHWVYSFLYRCLIKLSIRKRVIREKRLEKRYGHLKFEGTNFCPLSFDINYDDAFAIDSNNN